MKKREAIADCNATCAFFATMLNIIFIAYKKYVFISNSIISTRK
jgi:hypothetical protein